MNVNNTIRVAHVWIDWDAVVAVDARTYGEPGKVSDTVTVWLMGGQDLHFSGEDAQRIRDISETYAVASQNESVQPDLNHRNVGI